MMEGGGGTVQRRLTSLDLVCELHISPLVCAIVSWRDLHTVTRFLSQGAAPPFMNIQGNRSLA